ncbi:probable galactinol--sucrose galactosyltransferase 6 [Miscanthus floridulus]|uniref:probable galactinol--sucrose galactosyltransferase 6 n=1 Tax=Miscanthus floridulus TaxID=154761 RepID=UPI0034588CA2
MGKTAAVQYIGPSTTKVAFQSTVSSPRSAQAAAQRMAQRMGEKGGDVPRETQFLLVESKGATGDEATAAYVVFLPLVEGAFRASLQGGTGDALELCVESKDSDTRAASFKRALFMGAAESDPFAAISGAVAAAKSALRTFREGVETGLRSLIAGGAPPKFVIIDDGWQSVGTDKSTTDTDEPAGEDKSPLLSRLTSIKENSKFQKVDDPAAGIKTVVRAAKEEYGLNYVYVWHAITGYWGGVRPGEPGTEHYRSSMQFPKVSPGVVENEPGMKTDVLTVQGLGLVHPRAVYRFYDERLERASDRDGDGGCCCGWFGSSVPEADVHHFDDDMAARRDGQAS